MDEGSGSTAARILESAVASTEVVVPPPGTGDGFWAGAPSALWHDGAYYLAYRLRRPVDAGRGYANVIARSEDGTHFRTVATLTSDRFGAASLERPALVALADGGWRVYVSCSTANSKHWWVETVDAATLEELPSGERRVVLPGDAATAWKDVVVDRGDDGWRMWACRHPLDDGDDQADRMTSVYFTGDDGIGWAEHPAALRPTPGSWDARGTRIASVGRLDGVWTAFYDGRASASENWRERSAYATGAGPEEFTAVSGPTPAGRTIRYLSVVRAPSGHRVYFEASRPDGAHELRTAFVGD